jgi:hypothetical protein
MNLQMLCPNCRHAVAFHSTGKWGEALLCTAPGCMCEATRKQLKEYFDSLLVA